MPLSYQLTFLPEGRSEPFAGSRGNYYRLEDGSEIELYSDPVWCTRCGTVTHGERLDPVAQIDKRIADLERLCAEYWRDIARPPLPTPDAPGDAHEREQIAELVLRRAWRIRRRSPPRCLLCGTTRITPLEFQKPVRAGAGSIVLDVKGFCSTYFNLWYFTPEGERIPEHLSE